MPPLMPRRGSLVALCLTICLGTVIDPRPGAALEPPTQPILLSDTEIDWIEGQSGLLTLAWTTGEAISDLQVRASSHLQGVAIDYPDPGLDHAPLYSDDELSANEVDSTAFMVRPTDETPPEGFMLRLDVSWISHGTAMTAVVELVFDQRRDDGEPFLVLTDSAEVPAVGDGSRNWVELSFVGLDDGVRDITVSIDGALPVYYPQTSYTSLHHDDDLEAGERDVARFWLDPASIDPGTYELIVLIDYDAGDGPPQHVRRQLTVTVDG